jgi:hypothetical protein
VGQANFDWIIKEVADLAIAKAKAAPQMLELNWASFLNAAPATKPAKKAAAKKKPGSSKSKKPARPSPSKPEHQQATAPVEEPV